MTLTTGATETTATGTDDRVQVVVRLDKDLVKEIDHIAVDWEVFRQEAVARLLRYGITFVRQNPPLLIATGTA